MDWYTKNDMVCVPVYKDLTGQYTDNECDEDNCVEIPVPMILMKDFFKDKTDDEIRTWAESKSTCDETLFMMDFLENHNYFWKRLK